MGKLKVFQAAKRLNLSSEGLIAVLKELNFAPRGYTSYITDEEFEAARLRLRKEKKQFKESIRRRRPARQRSRQQPRLNEKQIARNVKQTLVKVHGREIKHKRPVHESRPTTESQTTKIVKVNPYMTVAELAHALDTPAAEVIKKCMKIGLLATVNQRLDLDMIMLVADECGVKVKQENELVTNVKRGEPETRPPVIVVMGHVDHGKTALLDYIRKTKVAEHEVGRITQHTGAYVATYDGRPIIFLDTPGHEAFTAMRARGAQVTDIGVLVVAADDGVMPQTLEAIDHARAAGIPIIVTITKMDLLNANADRVKSQLAQHGITVEGYGGHTPCIETSAVTGQGVEELLDAISVISLEMDLKAPYDGPARGVVIEARIDRGRGNIATILVQEGTLRRGDPFVAAEHYGRVRGLLSETFERTEEATPSIPIQVLGFSGLPEAGDRFDVTADERTAREIAQRRFLSKRARILSSSRPKVSLEAFQERIAEGQTKELTIILKADVSGSAEALRDSLEGLSLDEVRVKVIHTGVGPINKSDVLLAQASCAILVGFHIRPLPDARRLAEKAGVEIRTYRIIYTAIDDIRAAMLGLLEPEKKEIPLGKAEVRKVFNIPRQGLIAGSCITEGKATRDAQVRVLRQGKEIFCGKVNSLRRFKDDVKEVETGLECGIGLEGIDDLEESDILELYRIEEIARANFTTQK
ncbi:translation initiation factor IF-2 [candidate division WOR-3 bacterium JGI_Cruoil_03_51_56]|uniref:Translation initiation factor IF-2 n=1 Tax=candidate division WOR-3 bacterium JGI_Cruoil_03_51_56 TaxID=1973747 RepID=A0A235BU78_UNCW3|nr:MAG: translation initiation factor IF-2 [candidate division WOR-3 bacterium JGI_Cruoil_03_51_56]